MSNNQPLVSVIMNCYNSDTYLKEAIDSVMAQTYTNWEIIFWDNQSTDKSGEIAKSYNDERIKYFYAPEHTTLGAARNCALEKSSGEYIAFLDCDDLWMEEKLARQTSAMIDNPDADFCYTNYLYWIVESNKKTPIYEKVQPSGDIFESLLYKYQIGMLTVMLRKGRLDDMLEKFDPSLRLTEEFDLFMRTLLVSKAVYVDYLAATYRLHGKNCSIQEQHGWEQEVLYVAKKLEMADKTLKYKKAIYYLFSLAAFYGARADLVKGEMNSARLKIAKHRFDTFKFFLVYIAAFVPKRVWLLFKPVWSNGVFR